MKYRSLRAGALMLLVVLFILLSYSIRQTPQPVMQTNDAYVSIEALYKSISTLNSIEYKQYIKTSGLGNRKEFIEMHYYYKKPCYLRIETKNNNNITVDIYRTDGMYEYFPLSQTAYYREKWKDGKPVTFQLEDKLQDIMIRGKYDMFKMEKLGNLDCEIIRSVDENGGKIYEHRVWLASISGMSLPVKEEYLVDGELGSTHEYQYILINKDIDDSVFELKQSSNLKIYNVEGIPKLVKDEIEAEKYVGFNVVIPKYTPRDFKMFEIFIVPPVKTPSVLLSYISDMEIIYLKERNIRKNELITGESDKTITAGGKKFAVSKFSNDMIAVRWVKNGIEFEITGAYTLKGEIIKMVHDISGVWISVE